MPVPGRRPGFFSRQSGRLSPQKQAHPAPVSEGDDLVADRVVPSEGGTGFVLVESPNSKMRARKALEREAAQAAQMNRAPPTPAQMRVNAPADHVETLVSESGGAGAGAGAGVVRPPVNRVKNLPHPPVGPVLPDFDDIIRTRPRGGSAGEMLSAEDTGLKRKTSLVKKFKDKMAM